MNQAQRVDLGSVHIHKMAIAEIVSLTINEIEGVSLIPNDWWIKALEFCGYKDFAGVVVKIHENEEITIEAKVRIRYGMNIPDIAQYIQNRVKLAVEKITDLHIRDIHVNVQGIERGAT